MKVIDKISVDLVGSDTTNIKFEQLQFNDGSIRVVMPNLPKTNFDKAIITAFIDSMDDLIVISQIQEILNRHYNLKMHLRVLGTAYTRYDRVMFENKSDAFGAKCFAQMLNSLNLYSVCFYDPHSQVIIDEVRNSTYAYQMDLVDLTVDQQSFGLICPDAGARKKNPFPTVVCDKDRDPETGKIKGMKIVEKCQLKLSMYKRLLVVDDICEGGGTFLGLYDTFAKDEQLRGRDISLYITHGIFSNNAIPKLLEKFVHIYVYCMKESVYNALTETQKLRLTVNTLVNA